MNKAELINTVAQKTDLPKTLISKIIDTVIETIEDAVARGESVTLVGFGTFSLIERKERRGRNPRTGETMVIPARKDVKFKAGKRFKERLS